MSDTRIEDMSVDELMTANPMLTSCVSLLIRGLSGTVSPRTALLLWDRQRGDKPNKPHPLDEQPAGEPVAWRIFDGEGGYDYRGYDDNEGFADEWNRRNPKHVGWVEPLYTAPAAARVPLTPAAADVFAERRRQVESEGWTPEHDDEHGDGSLAAAAACYALGGPASEVPICWPWASSWWKPSPDVRRNLVKAGALLLAEIERLDRASTASQEAYQPAAARVPQGWKLVHAYATYDMLRAMSETEEPGRWDSLSPADRAESAKHIRMWWEALLAAAPVQPIDKPAPRHPLDKPSEPPARKAVPRES